MRRTGFLIVVLMFISVACDPNASSTAHQSTKAAKVAADRKTISAGLIRPADLRGWVHSPPTSDSDPDLLKLARKVPGCEHFVEVVREGRPKRDSKKFERDDHQVDDSVEAYASTAEAADQLDLARDPATLTCQKDIFGAFSANQLPATIKRLDISPIAINELGDSDFAFRVTISMDLAGQSVDLLFDTAIVQVGRFVLSFNATAPDTAGLAQLETTLLPVLVARLKKAGASLRPTTSD